MSYKHVGTAADLVRFGCSLRVECDACAAAHTLTAVEVATRCGTGNLERIRRRFKCQRCGKNAATLVVLPPV